MAGTMKRRYGTLPFEMVEEIRAALMRELFSGAVGPVVDNGDRASFLITGLDDTPPLRVTVTEDLA
jgi:hypothetical protein